MQAIIYHMCDQFHSCRVDVTGWDTYDNYLDCVRALDYTSSPGYPYMFEAPTIGDWLGYNGVGYNDLRLANLWIHVKSLMDELDFSDCYWRVFIKQEPHKLKKFESKRWRLIMCPPLHLQVLWQMVFAKQNDMEIQRSFSIPSQQGMVLCNGGWKYYRRLWLNQGTTSGCDKTAWDWTMPAWAFALDLEFRSEQLLKPDGKWNNLARKLYVDAFMKTKLFLSDGTVYQQTKPGVMKSGCVNTISTNSHAQFMLHVLYSIDENLPIEPVCRSCGDDTLQHQMHTEKPSVYEKYGVLIKSVSDTLEFMGHEFRDDGPHPMYVGKHVFRVLHCKEDLLVDTLQQYHYLYAHDDRLYAYFDDMADMLGLRHLMHQRRHYLYWYDSPNSIGSMRTLMR